MAETKIARGDRRSSKVVSRRIEQIDLGQAGICWLVRRDGLQMLRLLRWLGWLALLGGTAGGPGRLGRHGVEAGLRCPRLEPGSERLAALFVGWHARHQLRQSRELAGLVHRRRLGHEIERVIPGHGVRLGLGPGARRTRHGRLRLRLHLVGRLLALALARRLLTNALVRTGGEARVSNFLLWQLAYTELYFTPVLWPDFRREHLYAAVEDYQKRERRFGKTGEQVKS